MIAFVLLIIAISLIVTVKHTEAAPAAYVLVISTGTILNSYFPGITQLLTVVILAILIIRVLIRRNGKLPRRYILTMGCLTLYSIFFTVVGIHDAGDLNDIYVLVLLPSIVYFSVFDGQTQKKQFIDYYKFYIFFSWAIMLYRTVIDYSFFGYALSNDIYGNYYNLYTAGGILFRPSDLLSPIIFAIEVVFAAYLYLCKYGVCRRTILFSIGAGVSVLIMRCRSGIVLALFLIACMLIVKKDYKKGAFISFLGVLFVIISGRASAIVSIINFSESSYGGRFASVRNTLTEFGNLDIINIFFGKGFGTANQVIDGSITQFYSENYFVALLVDVGVFGLLVFLAFTLSVIWNNYKSKHKGLAVSIIGLILVNVFASSLSNYVIQILYWYFIIYSFYLNEQKQAKTDLGLSANNAFEWIDK